jgi:hypothetical protein
LGDVLNYVRNRTLLFDFWTMRNIHKTQMGIRCTLIPISLHDTHSHHTVPRYCFRLAWIVKLLSRIISSPNLPALLRGAWPKGCPFVRKLIQLHGLAFWSLTGTGLTICCQTIWKSLRNHDGFFTAFPSEAQTLNDRPFYWSVRMNVP